MNEQLIEMLDEDYERYDADPLHDGWLRAKYNVPSDRYYMVRKFPLPHYIVIDLTRTRTVPKNKISKSDQQ